MGKVKRPRLSSSIDLCDRCGVAEAAHLMQYANQAEPGRALLCDGCAELLVAKGIR